MSEALVALSGAFTLAFVLSSMFSMGLRLTIGEIIEPLRDVRLVAMAILANYVVVPGAALLLARLLIDDVDIQTGLILLSVAAGAPLAPKLAAIAMARPRLAVGLVVLMVVLTVIYLPIVLPLLVPGIRVDTMTIFTSLALQMLVPFAAGLVIRARYPEEAADILPVTAQIANVSLVLMLLLMIGLNVKQVISLAGTGAIIAAILFVVVAMAAGYLAGGRDPQTRRTVAIITGQRNIAAALIVATGNFAERPTVLVMLTSAALLGIIIAIPVVGELRRRADATEASPVIPEAASQNVANPGTTRG